MNRTKIEWADYTWNPITGCNNYCFYCYARKMAYRLKGRYGYPKDKPFSVTFHKNRMDEPYKLTKPSVIFCCSMSDLFDEQVKREWFIRIFQSFYKAFQHQYIVLTKQPIYIPNKFFPSNVWIGVSVSSHMEIMNIDILNRVESYHKIVCFEPLMNLDIEILNYTNFKNIDWIIVGAMTGSKKYPIKKKDLQAIIDIATFHKIPLFIKDNVNFRPKIQEYPEQLRKLKNE